jgi:hypothetical protein
MGREGKKNMRKTEARRNERGKDNALMARCMDRYPEVERKGGGGGEAEAQDKHPHRRGRD